jgi:hypothetical protein
MPADLGGRARKYAFDHKVSSNSLLQLSLEQYLDQLEHPGMKDEHAL